MKTIKYLLFFGGFVLFFGFGKAHASTGQATPVNQLRAQIYSTFNNTFCTHLNEANESVTVEFVLGPDNHLQVVEVTGGNEALRKMVRDKFPAIEAHNTLTNERYTVQLTFNLI